MQLWGEHEQASSPVYPEQHSVLVPASSRQPLPKIWELANCPNRRGEGEELMFVHYGESSTTLCLAYFWGIFEVPIATTSVTLLGPDIGTDGYVFFLIFHLVHSRLSPTQLSGVTEPGAVNLKVVSVRGNK